MTDRDIFLGLLGAGLFSLLIAICCILFGEVQFRPNLAFAWAFVGIGFMISAVAMALYEQRAKAAEDPRGGGRPVSREPS